MIFQYVRTPRTPATPAGPDGSRFDSYKPLLAPMLVCQKWHTLITQDATLWNEIDLIERDMTGPVVQHLLERSKAASLDIRFSYPGFVKDGRKKITSFLKTHAHRFGSLEVKLQKIDRTAKMLPLLDIPMPRLKCLVISLGLKEREEQPKNVHDMSFARLPALKALALSGTLLRPKESIQSLTHLHVVGLENDSILSLMEALCRMPSLEVLDLRMIRLTTGNVKQPSRMFPSLRMLRISHSSWSNTVHFLLSHLIAPNLAVVYLANVAYWTYDNPEAVRAYIPPDFLHHRTTPMLKIKERPWGFSSGFTAVLEGTDFKLSIQEDANLSKSIFSVSPLLECLNDVEDTHINVFANDPSVKSQDILWLGAHVSRVKSLVMRCLTSTLSLLTRADPVLLPELVSLGVDVGGSHNREDVAGRLAPALRERAKLVGRPLSALRLEGYKERLTQFSRQNLGSEIAVQVEIFPSSSSNYGGLWTSSPCRRDYDGHGYWATTGPRGASWLQEYY